jgi:hypothetical protein
MNRSITKNINKNINKNKSINKSKKETYKDIYNVFYIATIKKMITEKIYIDALQKLNTIGFKTYHIDNFEKLSLHLQSIGLEDSFNISILMYLRDTNYKKMSEVAILFSDIGEIFATKKKKMVDRMLHIRNILKQKLDIIKVFRKIEKANSFSVLNDSGLQMLSINSITKGFSKMKMTKDMIEAEFKYYVKMDIIDRLHLLVDNHYSLNQLQYMGVELKYASDIHNMTHDDLEDYYIDVLNKIDKSLKMWMIICRMYIDIEVNYIECCENISHGIASKLDLKHFTINIREL